MIGQDTLHAMETPPCTSILGVPVHTIDTCDAIQLMEQWIQHRDKCYWIAVTSSHGIVEGYKHPEFKAILKSADLSLPDGKWTARVAGRKASGPVRQARGTDVATSGLGLVTFLGRWEDRAQKLPHLFRDGRKKRLSYVGIGKHLPEISIHRGG